jgi:ribonucleotide reductase alpha subunit
VGKLYEEAWKCGCKGATVYRDGSRAGVLIASPEKEEKKEEKTVCFPYDDAHFVRPKELKCDVVRFQNAKDKWIAFVGLKDGRPYEIFTGFHRAYPSKRDRCTQQARSDFPVNLFFCRVVPEISKADKHRHQCRRKGIGTEYP